MSALAKLLLAMGKEVSGSDAVRSKSLSLLIKKGARVRAGNFPTGVRRAELVVYTAAIAPDNPDLLLARKLGKPVVERAVFLGLLSRRFKSIVAVSGTHGKTSTTAMLAECLSGAGKNPTVHLGGDLGSMGGNLRIGGKDIFLTEACEFNKSFLHIFPGISVITNIEPDHMDCYKTEDALTDAFKQFARQTKELVVVGCSSLTKSDFDTRAKIVTFGLSNANDVYAENIKADERGCCSFDLFYREKYLDMIYIATPGKHQVLNALAAIAVCLYLGVDIDYIREALSRFAGVDRRFELLYQSGEIQQESELKYEGSKQQYDELKRLNVTHLENEVQQKSGIMQECRLRQDKGRQQESSIRQGAISIYHDYAHHPTEIRAALDTARILSKGRVICVFQPHTYTRTQFLWEEFRDSFVGADVLIMVPTYAAREKEIVGARAEDLIKVISNVGKIAFATDKVQLGIILRHELIPNDTVIFMGAGTIENIAHEFVAEITQNPLT